MLQTIKALSRTASGLAILGVILFGFALVAWIELNELIGLVRYRCSDFNSAQAAKDAYAKGATYLDGNDKDGIPCEKIYR